MRSNSPKKRAVKPTLGNGDNDLEHALGKIEAPAPNGQQGDYRSKLEEAGSNARAIFKIIEAQSRVTSADEAAITAIETVREAFGWAYGSYWALDPADGSLRFAVDSGSVSEEFRTITATARFREGEGLSGRAWKARELVFVADLAEVKDCCRAPVARRAGVRSGVCVPILVADQVVGTMDFFARRAEEITPTRLDALRAIGQLASDKISGLSKQLELTRLTRMIENAPTSMMFADRELKIRYLNPASFRLLKRVEAYLPCKVDEMVGQSIDIFHKTPEHQRRILADPKNLPH
ncbi:MAG: GAF domain-containing protein, partial [Singulisphaera sp.]|nr:GAF domain-containing protein [Singulisphaera sp.]